MSDFIVVEDPAPSPLVVVSESLPVDVVTTSEQGPPGPPGPTGPAGPQGQPGVPGYSSAYYVHEQAVASATWTIVHNFGRMPKVTVIDSAGDEVEGDNSYPDLNTLVVTFSAPFGGFAYLN